LPFGNFQRLAAGEDLPPVTRGTYADMEARWRDGLEAGKRNCAIGRLSVLVVNTVNSSKSKSRGIYPVPREIAALLSSERLILRETKRAVTPFGGVAVFVAFWRKIDLVGQLRQYMPIQWKSRNQIEPTTTASGMADATLALTP
jgi:hypothetical protein